MARPRRIKKDTDAHYHLMSRTNDRRFLFEKGELKTELVETLEAVRACAKLGMVVLPYINADPVLARHCEDAGAAAVMPLGSPIGSNRGIRTRDMIEIIVEQSHVPVVVDAGIGLPSHAAEAIELGADAVLANTAVAAAGDPVKMAEAFKLAVRAAELALEAKPPRTSTTANATSPMDIFK